MVGRLQQDEALIVDLDGTLLSVNSFSRFVVWLWKKFVADGHLHAAGCVAIEVFRRKLRLCTHAEAKKRIMEVARHYLSERDFANFGHGLCRYMRSEVKAFIDERKHARTVLATAAPEDYAKAVAAECGFDFLLASRAETEECKGEEKLRRIKALCEYNGLHIRNVMTDHHDDLPLLKLPGVENVLVDPSVETIKILNNQSIKYIILK